MKKFQITIVFMLFIFTLSLLLVGCGRKETTKKAINSITANVTTTADYKYEVSCVISEKCEYSASCKTNDDLNYATLTIIFNESCEISKNLKLYLYVDNEMLEVNNKYVVINDNTISYEFLDAYWSKAQ